MLFNISCDGALALAPIGNPKRVLDIATGTGIWAMDFGNLITACATTDIVLTRLQLSSTRTHV